VPLHEIVLRFPDRNEVRLTGGDGFRTGEEIVIARRRFVVTGTEPPETPGADNRFVVVPSDERMERTGIEPVTFGLQSRRSPS
jgi:hypothetical protein